MALVRRTFPRQLHILYLIGGLFSLAVGAGCGLVRTKKPIELPPITRVASLSELTTWLAKLGNIRSMKATVNMQVAVVSEDRSEVTEYTDVRGFILSRRPAMIRTIAQIPVVRSTAFEMVSDGKTFRVHLPSQNRFFEGENEINSVSKKRMYNIRPQHLQEAVMIRPPVEGLERPMLDTVVESTRIYQVLDLVEVFPDGPLKLRRKLWFDRTTFQLARLQIFNDKSEIVTDARYSDWDTSDGLPWPERVSLYRPIDGYRLNIHILKPGLNEEIPDSSFVLEPPEGMKVERIGDQEKAEQAAANGTPLEAAP